MQLEPRDQEVVEWARQADQGHVVAFLDQLEPPAARALLDQLAEVDFAQLARLAALVGKPAETPARISPPPLTEPAPHERAELAERGWEALRAGQVACLVVAGGQGTRLGWPGPKGTFPVAPVSEKTLFQLFAESILATSRRALRPIPWYVLTSRENRAETEAFFRQHDLFGLEAEQVRFIVQRDLPAVDGQGKMLLAARDRLATSPNGHGGTLEALTRAGALAQMQAEGVEHLCYFQVDNPLCWPADPVFLGAHIMGEADISTKVVEKTDPAEKIGLVVRRGEDTGVVEYSEMSPAEQQRRDPDGKLSFRAGNTAIHVFSRAFLQGLGLAGYELPYHLAHKAVPYLDSSGQLVQPEAPNAWKFEMFIFDLLARAERHVALVVDRAEEFEPLKNKSGPYSPETVRRAQCERHRRWLAAAGRQVSAPRVEVSPLSALDPQELAERLDGLSPREEGDSFLV